MPIDTIEKVLSNIKSRSATLRKEYLQQCDIASSTHPARSQLSSTNLAHSYAAAEHDEKNLLRQTQGTPNLAIVTAYNDMLSAHQPYYRYPEKLKRYALNHGATAQVAGGTPAMCDGVTQGQPGMELSLFSRDIIALSTAVALSHNTFDGGLYLGICDKIVPGLLMGALSFGHLPGVFIPSGPMASGISNEQKAQVRVDFAEGKIGKEQLLESEEKSYHSQGTCTFYGTANSNQMLLEFMGLQLPGSAFVFPETPLRDALTENAVQRLVKTCLQQHTGLGYVMEAENLINGVIGLLATGGSTNHTLHLVAIARACGWILEWQDIAELSNVIPLLTRIYPNGSADVNAFHNNGGTPVVLNTLAENDLLFSNIQTAYNTPFNEAICFPYDLKNESIHWISTSKFNLDDTVVRPATTPFQNSGGLKLLQGNIGKAIIKVSSLKSGATQSISAPAIVFESQGAILAHYKDGKLNQDFIAVLPWQGPKANGMPELHKLTPPLTSLQNKGFNVALITDGRMSGASGKFPAAIHLTPEAADGGVIAKIKTGDHLTLDWSKDQLYVDVSDEELAARTPAPQPTPGTTFGRSLMKNMRTNSTPADQGASFIL